MGEHSAEKDVPVLSDEHGYPTAEALDFLRTFTGSAHQLVEHLAEAMRAYGGVWIERVTDDYDRPVYKVNMATGGWSGNEEIVGHLERSFFWFAYWQTSRRGGGYTFHVPSDRWDGPMIEWPPARVFPSDNAEKDAPEKVRTDYGLMLDCDANGCEERHSDHGEVLPRGAQPPVIERVNGHAVTPVERTVTYSKWCVIPPGVGDQGGAS